MDNAALRQENVALRTENTALKRGLGTDSTNSSVPPSQDSPAAKGKRRARQSQRLRSKDRKPGGQPGRAGSGLTPAVTPDRAETALSPRECSGCGGDLADGRDAGTTWAQVWDIPPVRLEKVHYVLPKRRCSCCGTTTTAQVPFGQPGAVTYGLTVNAAAILLSSAGNVPVERTAMLMAALLGSPVSSGFVARAHERFAQKLDAAGFDRAMREALAVEEVLHADETPVNVVRKNTDEDGVPVVGSPHVVILRTPQARLSWYRALPARSKKALCDLGLLNTDGLPGGFTGYLVRDDYSAWHQFDSTLAGVQQCVAHLFRHLQGVLDLDPDVQAWAGKTREVLREAHAAVDAAVAAGKDRIDPEVLAGLRDRYDKHVRQGRRTNRLRDWDKGYHPGYNLATRLRDKADQVWLFTTVFSVPWTNNPAEQALKSPKLHQKVSGYWHTLTTLARFCTVRSYLTSAVNHGITAIDAIEHALTGNPWTPPRVTAT
ncbi:IS66 family transposase [Amycolatopsis sp. H20-H5]|uniref:IS66 family transposase n=1 Tax=Amycolatopsis sp. H20-H5 TaxID=3046309 RepID=UPI002DB939DC|nr:IS66 family transposase [Amycolatopsis sp. H20-H5]MEC3974523.1 IS66 family transposase [Amycolatopsis sp. H20-H5]